MHPSFRDKANQQALYRLLRAYAAYDPEIGYCQGMNFVAGAVLLYLAPGESDAFAAMVVLMQERGLRGHYTHDMRMLQVLPAAPPPPPFPNRSSPPFTVRRIKSVESSVGCFPFDLARARSVHRGGTCPGAPLCPA